MKLSYLYKAPSLIDDFLGLFFHSTAQPVEALARSGVTISPGEHMMYQVIRRGYQLTPQY